MSKTNLKMSISEEFTVLDSLCVPAEIYAPFFSIFSCLGMLDSKAQISQAPWWSGSWNLGEALMGTPAASLPTSKAP